MLGVLFLFYLAHLLGSFLLLEQAVGALLERLAVSMAAARLEALLDYPAQERKAAS
jgi:hypothetical protein